MSSSSSEKSFFHIPYRIILIIIGEFYEHPLPLLQYTNSNSTTITTTIRYSTSKQTERIKYKLNYFFGFFSRDKFRKIFLIFRSISFNRGDYHREYQSNGEEIINDVMKEFPTRNILHINFEDVFEKQGYILNEKYLEKCENILFLKCFWKSEKYQKLINGKFLKKIEKIELSIEKFIKEHEIEIQKMKKLKNLSIIIKSVNNLGNKSRLLDIDFDQFEKCKCLTLRLQSLPFFMKLKSSFRIIPLNRLLLCKLELNSEQIEDISRKSITFLKLLKCYLPDNYTRLFSIKTLKHLHLGYAFYKIDLLKNVVVSKDLPLQKIILWETHNIPVEFFSKIFEIKELNYFDLQACHVKDDFIQMLLNKETKQKKNENENFTTTKKKENSITIDLWGNEIVENKLVDELIHINPKYKILKLLNKASK